MARVLLLGPPPREWPLSSSCPAFSLSPALAAAASGSGRSSGRIHPPADPPAVPRAQGLRAAGRRRRSIGSSEENRRTRAPRATGAQAVGKGGRRRKEEEEEEEEEELLTAQRFEACKQLSEASRRSPRSFGIHHFTSRLIDLLTLVYRSTHCSADRHRLRRFLLPTSGTDTCRLHLRRQGTHSHQPPGYNTSYYFQAPTPATDQVPTPATDQVPTPATSTSTTTS